MAKKPAIQLSDHHVRAAYTFYAAVRSDDDIYIDIRHGGRLFRLQSCGQNSFCLRKSHYTVSSDTGRRGRNARRRRQRACG